MNAFANASRVAVTAIGVSRQLTQRVKMVQPEQEQGRGQVVTAAVGQHSALGHGSACIDWCRELFEVGRMAEPLLWACILLGR